MPTGYHVKSLDELAEILTTVAEGQTVGIVGVSARAHALTRAEAYEHAAEIVRTAELIIVPKVVEKLPVLNDPVTTAQIATMIFNDEYNKLIAGTITEVEFVANLRARLSGHPTASTSKLHVEDLFAHINTFHSLIRDAIYSSQYIRIDQALSYFKQWAEQNGLNLDFTKR